MKKIKSDFVSKTIKASQKNEKKYDEDEKNKNPIKTQKPKEEEKVEKGKFGMKALRKVLRKLGVEMTKDEMKVILWEVDEDLDGFISEGEFDRMYKRCIIDDKEQEAKQLFYLVQFLMYDKEGNRYITEEDTLELLYIRHGEKNFNQAIEDVFGKEQNKKETLNYLEYVERMHKLSLKKRDELLKLRKNYCDLVVKTGKFKE
jgi:Ca2+-binding EF-hand superfamily protein